MADNSESAFSYALQHVDSAAIIPKPEQVAAVCAVYKGKDVFVRSYKSTEGGHRQPYMQKIVDPAGPILTPTSLAIQRYTTVVGAAGLAKAALY